MAMYTFAQLVMIKFKLSMIFLSTALTVFQPTNRTCYLMPSGTFKNKTIKRIFKERK